MLFRSNQDRLVSATGAGYIEVLNPSFAEDAVRQAFYQARVQRRPVVLCYPMNVQDMTIDSDGDDYQPSLTLFTGQQRIKPADEPLAQAVKIIAASRKPVVLLGDGAIQSGAVEIAERLAQRICDNHKTHDAGRPSHLVRSRMAVGWGARTHCLGQCSRCCGV